MRGKLLSILALLCLTVSSAWATVVASGNCGTEGHDSDVKWTLTSDGVMTISGNGAMVDYWNSTPWLDNKYADDITSVVIEDGVTHIGDFAFFHCHNLASASIPASMASIGEMAFCECGKNATALEVTIADGAPLESIRMFAFANANLTSFCIPASVTDIGSSPFAGCSKLTAITVADGNSAYCSYGGVVFNKDKTVLVQYPAGKAGSYEIPASVKRIAKQAFYDCPALTSVIIPSSVKVIEESAFWYCLNLAKVYIHATSLTTYGYSVFEDDDKLTIYFPAGSVETYQNINEWQYYNIEAMLVLASGYCGDPGEISREDVKWVLTDDGVMTISGTGPMENYLEPTHVPWYSKLNSIKSIVLESGVTSIGDYAFNSCTNLATVTLNSNPYIGDNAFDNIASGATVTMYLTANRVGSDYWMTFCNGYGNFKADENTQVFQAELNGTTITLHEIADKIVNNISSVILISSGNPVMTLTTTYSSDSYFYNDLLGVHSSGGLSSNGKMFVLNNGDAGVGFYRLGNGCVLEHGKAFLEFNGNLAPEFLAFNEEDSADGIVSPLGETEEGAGAIFNLAGQRIQKMQRGINIVNGKKIINK